jgi:mannose-6-phosphate isomerase-like protein (cupin superfamily)
MKITKETARHYVWGGNCDGWHFLESDSLSVIRERIPPGGGEVLHYHERAQQLFFVLSGIATFEADGAEFIVREGEGFHVRPGVRHRIRNLGAEDLHFVVISAPKSHGDRFDENT